LVSWYVAYSFSVVDANALVIIHQYATGFSFLIYYYCTEIQV